MLWLEQHLNRLLAQGYQPVGKDFPVFLHPKTKDEYALARTERKQGHGYHGFEFFTSPDINLEQDLIRRDLTINAIARDTEGTLYDPYGGQQDLENKLLLLKTLCGFYAPPVLQHVMAFKLPPKPCN